MCVQLCFKKELYSPTFNVTDVWVPGTITLMALEILAASKHKSSVLVMEIGICLELLVAFHCLSTSIPTRYIKSPLALSGTIGFHDNVTEGVWSGSILLEGGALGS